MEHAFLTEEGALRHDSIVLIHRIRSVSPSLARHVEHLWMARGSLSKPWCNMILPDGAVELIFNLGDPQKLWERQDQTKYTVFRNSWISGERTLPIVIDESGFVHLVGVRFRPGGAWPFVGIPLAKFTDTVIEFEAVLGRQISDLRDRLGEVPNDDARFDVLDSWLMQRVRDGTAPTRSVSYALQIIQDNRDAVRIGCLAEHIGISHKHLLREFDRCVGLRPKTFARLCAFQRVIRLVGEQRDVNWTDTAVSCGYYDQAHLIREFHAFGGFTPTDYLTRRGPFLNYLEVTE